MLMSGEYEDEGEADPDEDAEEEGYEWVVVVGEALGEEDEA